MRLLYKEIEKTLPQRWVDNLTWNKEEKDLQDKITTVVLDDDPTGTQTVYDINIFTQGSESLILNEFQNKTRLFYILTNSRSLSAQDTYNLYTEIGLNIKKAYEKTRRKFRVICRSDSTLRGYYAEETKAVSEALNLPDAPVIFAPAFIEGGRYTFNDIHYLKINKELVPVNNTDFAKDATFGYNSSHLKEYVLEKTAGQIKKKDIKSLSLADIRNRGTKYIEKELQDLGKGQVMILNAMTANDLIVFSKGLLRAERDHAFVLRTAASIIPVLYGLARQDLLGPDIIDSEGKTGGLIFAGSYVSTTTRQLMYLLKNSAISRIEIDVNVLIQNGLQGVAEIADSINKKISNGDDLLVYTSRKVKTGKNPQESLEIINIVSQAIVDIIKRLQCTPRFFIAKGGITSSDIATKAYGLKTAKVLGQILPGIPVWKFEQSRKNRGQIYIVFPGNVGDEKSLYQVYSKLKLN